MRLKPEYKYITIEIDLFYSPRRRDRAIWRE